MNEARLRAIIAELDQLVPREGAVCYEDHGLYGSQVDPSYGGNRSGYLRLGIEFLKIAEAPPVPGQPTRVHADLGYLLHLEPQPVQPAIFERREITAAELISPAGVMWPPSPPSRLAPVLVGLGLIGLIGLGLRDVLAWIGHLLGV